MNEEYEQIACAEFPFSLAVAPRLSTNHVMIYSPMFQWLGKEAAPSSSALPALIVQKEASDKPGLHIIKLL